MICYFPHYAQVLHAFDEFYSNGGRAEPMKKANENRFFMAQVLHAFDEFYSNGGRAEPTKESFVGISFVAERPTVLL